MEVYNNIIKLTDAWMFREFISMVMMLVAMGRMKVHLSLYLTTLS